MIKFPGQYHSFRKTTLGDNLITFCVDANYSKMISSLVEQKIGTEFMIHLEDVTSETNINNTSFELDEKFVKKLHGLLGEYAELVGIKPEEAKKKLKGQLMRMELISQSTKELDIKGQAIACNLVEKWIKEHGTIEH